MLLNNKLKKFLKPNLCLVSIIISTFFQSAVTANGLLPVVDGTKKSSDFLG